MRRFDRLERLGTRVSELEDSIIRLEAGARMQSVEWAEMQGRLTKAFQRVERSNQRAAKREPPLEDDLPAEEASDPYSRKLALIRRQGGAVS